MQGVCNLLAIFDGITPFVTCKPRLDKRSPINLKSISAPLFSKSLNIFSNYGNNWGRSVDPTTNTFISTSSNFSGVGASSNMTLFSGLSIRNSIRQSKSLLEQSVFDLENTKNNVMLSVVSQYLNIMLVMDRLENARYQYQSTREQLSRTIKIVDAG